jgi:hypothetical protein
MSELKIGISPLTSEIYIGSVLKDSTWGKNKTNVTKQAPLVVAEYLVRRNIRIEFNYLEETYVLKVERKLKDFRDRLNKEYKDLDIKFKALNNFLLDEDKFNKLDNKNKELLHKQSEVMNSYLEILAERIKYIK